MDAAKKLMSSLGADQGLLERGAYLRRGTVTARDPATLTCTVAIGGVTDPEEYVDGIPVMRGFVPVVDEDVVLVRSGASWLAVGSLTAELPKVRMRSAGTVTITTEATWVFTGGEVEYDTDWNGSAGLFDSASGGITFRWPGKYAFGARGFVTTTAGFLPIARIRINGVTYIDAWQDAAAGSGSQGIHWTMHNEREFAAGDVITVRYSSSGGSSVFGTNSNEIGMAMWASYLP